MLVLALAACFPPTTPSTGKVDSGTAVDDTASAGGSGAWPADTGDSALPLPADSADSGIPEALACAPEIVVVPTALCAETTAVVRQAYVYADVGTTAAVTEVGGVLAPVQGSVPIGGFAACGATHLHQVRLVDALGATWTVGWDVEGAVDDASTDAIAVQATLDLHVVSDGSDYGLDLGIRLSDDAPLVFVESFGYLVPPLEDADRGGIAVVVPYDEGCLREDDVWGGEGRVQYRPITFLGAADGDLVLESGATATVDLGIRQLTLALTESVRLLGCVDACARTTWAAWATP